LSSERALWTNHIGNIHFAQRRFADAERYYTQALAQARAIRDPLVAAVLTNLGRTQLETGRTAEARRTVAEALAVARAGDQRLRAQIVEARIDAAGSGVGRAEKTLRYVAQARAGSIETRWTAEAYLAQLYAAGSRSALAEASFRRAIASVREARKAVAEPELRLSFFNTAEDLFDGYVAFLMRRNRVEDALAATEAIRAQTLEEGLAGDAPSVTDARLIARRTSATLLCYWLGRERSWVWTVAPDALSYAALPGRDAIDAKTGAYRRDLLGPRGTLRGSGARGVELYRMLVEPALRGTPKGARIVIIADGSLHGLNFETLVVASPSPHYWIEDAVLSSAASLQLLARSRPPSGGSSSMLLVGNPAPATREFLPLPRAGEEMQAVARRFKDRVLLSGPGATPAAYRGADPGRFQFVHFVAHGVATRRRPLDSAVILARGSDGEYRLFAREIIGERLAAQLVTISSCHGAGDRTFAGEGLVGLAWAFLRAGAAQVIGALWEVSDSATPELMDRMYAGIRSGDDPAVALRNAKLALVHGQGVYRMPRYWAPFVVYGAADEN